GATSYGATDRGQRHALTGVRLFGRRTSDWNIRHRRIIKISTRIEAALASSLVLSSTRGDRGRRNVIATNCSRPLAGNPTSPPDNRADALKIAGQVNVEQQTTDHISKNRCGNQSAANRLCQVI